MRIFTLISLCAFSFLCPRPGRQRECGGKLADKVAAFEALNGHEWRTSE